MEARAIAMAGLSADQAGTAAASRYSISIHAASESKACAEPACTELSEIVKAPPIIVSVEN